MHCVTKSHKSVYRQHNTGALKDAFNTLAILVDFLLSVVGLSPPVGSSFLLFLPVFEVLCGFVRIRVKPAFCDC